MASNEQIIRIMTALIQDVRKNSCEHKSTQSREQEKASTGHHNELKPPACSALLMEADLLLKELKGQREPSMPVVEPNQAALILDNMQTWGQKQLDKHGSIEGAESVEQWINQMTMIELLESLAGRGVWGNEQ